MASPEEDAIDEYMDKHQYPGYKPPMQQRSDGYFQAYPGDECKSCKGMTWPGDSGAHLKSVEHIAQKHYVSVAGLRKIASIWDSANRVSQANIRAQGGYVNNHGWQDDAKPEEPVPDFIKPIDDDETKTVFGWKACSFSIDERGDRILCSYNGVYAWKPFETAHAKCESWRPRTDQDIPGDERWACMEWDCGCGFYFFWQPVPATEYNVDRSVVVCAELGGTVLEAHLGCRSEYATIRGILNQGNPYYVNLASQIYGVPIINKEGDICQMEIPPADQQDTLSTAI